MNLRKITLAALQRMDLGGLTWWRQTSYKAIVIVQASHDENLAMTGQRGLSKVLALEID